ncbi:MAG: hypothetical protein KC419_10010 [Anaerolineales bacterium]|nr:hypothetical protein [Anaerolineales bacterium]
MNQMRNDQADPVAWVLAMEWMRTAVEEAPMMPTGETAVECFNCHQWRPDSPNNDQAQSCPHCGAEFVPF